MFRVVALLALVLAVSAFTTTSRRTASVIKMSDKSPALPFLPAPKNLVGLVGYKGNASYSASSSILNVAV